MKLQYPYYHYYPYYANAATLQSRFGAGTPTGNALRSGMPTGKSSGGGGSSGSGSKTTTKNVNVTLTALPGCDCICQPADTGNNYNPKKWKMATDAGVDCTTTTYSSSDQCVAELDSACANIGTDTSIAGITPTPVETTVPITTTTTTPETPIAGAFMQRLFSSVCPSGSTTPLLCNNLTTFTTIIVVLAVVFLVLIMKRL